MENENDIIQLKKAAVELMNCCDRFKENKLFLEKILVSRDKEISVLKEQNKQLLEQNRLLLEQLKIKNASINNNDTN